MSPTTLPEPPAFDARHDRGEVADVDLAAEDGARHRAADQRRRDVVEERREHEHHYEQHERAAPTAGQHLLEVRSQVRLFEVLREQREAEQESQQVRERDPLVAEVHGEAVEARSRVEAGDRELIGDDRGEARQRHLERMVVEQGDAGQREAEQHEVDGCAEPYRDAADDQRTHEEPAR